MHFRNTLLLPVLSASLFACGGRDNRAPRVGMKPSVSCPPAEHYDGRRCGLDAPPPPTASATTVPPVPPPPVPTVKGGPAAVPLDPVAARAASALLVPLGRQHAPAGARPIGAVIAGQFEQGQSLEQTVQMQPGHCYTVIGVGLPPVQDLDLQLVAAVAIPGLASPVIASDNTNAPTAAVGGKPNCFKWPAPFAAPIRVLVTVSAGQGVAAARVYER